MRQPIIIVTRKGTRIFRTVREASRELGISRHSLTKALQSDDGVIFGVRPVTCADYALLPEREMEELNSRPQKGKLAQKMDRDVCQEDEDGL